MLALQQAIWWRLQGELAEYIRKSDYQFADEELGSEADSPRRAIASLSGLTLAEASRRAQANRRAAEGRPSR